MGQLLYGHLGFEQIATEVVRIAVEEVKWPGGIMSGGILAFSEQLGMLGIARKNTCSVS